MVFDFYYIFNIVLMSFGLVLLVYGLSGVATIHKADGKEPREKLKLFVLVWAIAWIGGAIFFDNLFRIIY